MVKLLALDLDGTLTNARKEITPLTKEALMKAQSQGVRLILASGRPPYGIVPLAAQLEMASHRGIILAYNGGLVMDCATGATLLQQLLPMDCVPTLCRQAREAGLTIMTYQGDELLTEKPDDPYVQHASFINKIRIRQVPDFAADVPAPLYKCLIVGDPEPLHALEQKMLAENPFGLGIFRSMPFFLEVVPPAIDKARSLSRLVEMLGCSREELIAVGDGWNDAGMLRYAGLGVAMANAQDEVKSLAGYITTRTNEEDGVAEVVERFILA